MSLEDLGESWQKKPEKRGKKTLQEKSTRTRDGLTCYAPSLFSFVLAWTGGKDTGGGGKGGTGQVGGNRSKIKTENGGF